MTITRFRSALLAVSACAVLAMLVLLGPSAGAQTLGAARRAPSATCDPALTGTGVNDTIVGTPGDDHICGMGGADTIDGAGGNDIIEGGNGDDVIGGGLGNDVLR